MRLARCLVVVACLLPAWAVGGDEPSRAEPGEPATPSHPATPPSPETPPGPEPAIEASPPSPGDGSRSGPAGHDGDAQTEVTLDKSTRLAAGLAFGGPMGAVASVRFLHGLSADVRDDQARLDAVCAVPIPHCAQGFLLQIDGGSGGGKLGLGVGARARVDEEDFHGTVGFSLRASLLRTWGNPIGTEAGLSYLGPEIDLSVKRVDLSLGVLWRMGGHRGSSALFSWGVGFGL